MINIIKSDLYRFFHTKAIWALMIIMFCGTILTMSINFLMEEKYGKSESSEQYEDSEEEILVEANESDSVVIGYSGDVADESSTFVEALLTDTQSCIFLLFITIGVAIFVFDEDKNGYIKNIAGQVKHKSYLYISNMICVTLYSVLTFIIFEFPAYIMLKARYNMKFMHKGEEELLKYFFICVVLCLAFASFVAFITKLFKGTAISIAIGIMLSMGFEYLIFSGIGHLINFNLTDYLIVTNVINVQDMKNPLLVGLVSIIVYNVLGIILTEKRDAI